jgi:Ca-activated chloride channel family protein
MFLPEFSPQAVQIHAESLPMVAIVPDVGEEMFLVDEVSTKTIRERAQKGARWIEITIFAAFIVVAAGLWAFAFAATSNNPSNEGLITPNDVNMGSLLFPSKETGYYVEAPRLKTDVHFDISGPIIRARVTQRFTNPSKGWVEGTYVFPLPDDSAVDTLRMQIGDRFIEGIVKPRLEAQKIYEEAKSEGKKAALLEEQRPNIFTNQVANIGPGETIVIQIEYQQAVRQSSGVFSFRFPMVVAPRYNPQPVVQSVDLNSNTGYAVSDDVVPNREKIEAPVLDPRENAKINPVNLTIDLKPGFPLAEVTSPYHKIKVTKSSEDMAAVNLETDEVPADKDFELSWKAANGATPKAGLFKESLGGKTYLMAFITPPSTGDDNAPAPKREVIFVIDNSGSMAGPSMEQAKQSLSLAISKLGPNDRFNVIRFDDTMTVFFPAPVDANETNRQQAMGYVNGLTADGGTEMLPALEAALRNQGPIARGAIRQVVFLTDGAIGNEEQLFKEIERSRGDARVFTVGIGSAPNSFFMDKAAEIGRGTYTHIGSEQQVAERMGELFTKLENPVMTDIAATFENAKAEDITPNPVPDLYNGEPVLLTAEVTGKPDGKLQIIGKTGDKPWRVEMDVAQAADGTGISKLWARRKISDLEAEGWRFGDPAILDKKIEDVAMAHHLVSRVTSLVAVDVTRSRPTGEPLDQTKVPLNLPEGWDFDKIYGEQVPANMPIHEREAVNTKLKQFAMATAGKMAAAPTAKAASIVAADVKAVDLPAGSTTADLQIWVGLVLILMSGFGAVMLLRLPRRTQIRIGART